MADDGYRRLLDATIAHLETLQGEGVEFVPVRPDTLRQLTAPVATPAPPARAVRPPPSTTPSPVPAAVSRPVAPAPAAPAIAVPVARPLPPKLPPAERDAAFAHLRERALACRICPHLASSRRNVAFGVGTLDARIMFVGEAPGMDEDAQGEPFVGAAGQLLTKIIQTMGLDRDRVYIANILKCRPDTPGQATGNRKPTPEEMAACIPYLHEQIDLIQPEAMIALGATAVEGLLGRGPVGITRLRGQWQTYRGIPLMPTFHPSYLLRTQALSDKRRVWEDMLAVMERLGMPVSEKQRGYFLRAG